MKIGQRIALALLLGAGIVWGQQVSQIAGSVTDSSGAGIPAALVTVTNTDTSITHVAQSGANGEYTVTNLAPGPYKLTAEKAGFATYNQNGIIIQVDSNPQINVTMKVGAVSESVEVNAQAAMVETHSNAIGQVIDQQRVVDLPLNGRQITDLASLSGATLNLNNIMASGGTTQATALVPNRNYPTDAAISIAGGGGGKTNYMLDGTLNFDIVTGAGLPFPFPDALQEFKLETSSLPASAGQLPGGVVNVVTKSGTNTIHGALFEFLRNYDLDARNFFAVANDGLRQNQYGGDVGGPAIKNKLFFFGGYQGTSVSQVPSAYQTYFNTAETIAGNFTDIESAACNAGKAKTLAAPYVNNILPASLISPVALKIAALVPLSTNPCGLITFGIPVHSQENQDVVKVDYQLSSKQSLFGRYFYTNYSHPSAYTSANLLLNSEDASVGITDRVQTASVGDTYILNASTINTFHLGFSRNAILRDDPSTIPTWQSLGAGVYSPIPDYFNMSITSYFTGNCGNCSPGPWASTSYSLNDEFSMIRGRHQLSFGFFMLNQRLWAQGNIRTSGSFSFGTTLAGNGLANFIAGLSSSFTQNSGQYIDWHYHTPSAYAADNFHVNSHLTVNLGVRWDPLFPYEQYHAQVSIFNPTWYANNVQTTRFTNSPPGVLYTGDAGMPGNNAMFFGKLAEFAPRVGVVYDPQGKGTFTIRSGFGIFYDIGDLGVDQNTSNPFQLATSVTNPVSLTNPWAGSQYGSNPYPQAVPTPNNVAFYQFEGSLGAYKLHPDPEYVEQWNLAIQKQLPGNWLLSGTYLGNHTVHLTSSDSGVYDPTIYVPGTCSATPYDGLTTTGNCSSTGNEKNRSLLYLQNPVKAYTLGVPGFTGDSGISNYNGLVLSAQHRFSQNYTLLVNDTWSRCMTRTGGQNPLVWDYTNCGQDIRNQFNLSSVVSSPKFSSKFVEWIAGNWQQSTIFSKLTGPYESVTTGVDSSLTGDTIRPNYVAGTSPTLSNPTISEYFNTAAFVAPGTSGATYGCSNPTPVQGACLGNVGPNTIQGPGAWNVDAALFRSFNVPVWKEQTKLAFRIEAFNLFNHTRFAPPNSAMNSAAFGQIQYANTPRIMQASLKLTF